MPYYDFNDYGAAKQVDGGIKARSKMLGGETWWAKRWIESLTAFNLGARLTRGRTYARQGQVVSIAVSSKGVDAKVQGSRPKPYNVKITVEPLTAAQWDAVIDTFRENASFVAKLSAGDMPRNIEDAFNESGVSLFPTRLRDIDTDCSCPDDSNPCKHIAAVYYLLGEEFDRNPFLIFELRGLDRAMLENKLAPRDEPPTTEPIAKPAPVPADPDWYWGVHAIPETFGELEIPHQTATIIKRLGNVPFWQGEDSLYEAVKPLYAAASVRALDLGSDSRLGGTGVEDEG